MKKRLSRLLALFLAISTTLFTACGSIGAGNSSSTADTTAETTTDTTSDADYATTLFDTSYVHTIDISISEEDLADLLENPTDKTKYETTVTIDGEEISDVSFSTKGNTSLSSVASDEESDRYSFKINFGKYVDGQTYHGLDKLNLNNIYADATYLKEYLSYTLFAKAGADAPLVSFISVTINLLSPSQLSVSLISG